MTGRNLFSLFRQDLLVSLRNSLFWFLVATVLLLVVVVHFALPSGQAAPPTVYFFDGTHGKLLEQALLKAEIDAQFMASAATVEQAVSEDHTATGVVVQGTIDAPRATIIHSGQVSQQQVNIIHASLEQLFAALTGTEQAGVYTVELLRETAEPIPPNLSAVPAMLIGEVVSTAFMLAAVLLFQEKQDGSILAYRVSPGTTTGYILSKTLVLTLMCLLLGTGLVMLTVGPTVNWLLLPTITLAAIFFTLAGIIIGVFYDNLSEWLLPGGGIIVLSMLPLISYAYPAFAPKFITWIPTYQIVFAVGETLFPTGRSVLPAIWLLLALIAVAWPVCHLLVRKRLLREGS